MPRGEAVQRYWCVHTAPMTARSATLRHRPVHQLPRPHVCRRRWHELHRLPARSDQRGRVLRGVECASGRIRIKEDFFVVPDGGVGIAGDARLRPNMMVQPCREYGVCAAVEPGGASMRVRTECLGNTTGPLCASCVDGFGKAAGSCVACPAGGAQVAIMLVFALACMALCLLMTKKSLQSELDLITAPVSVLRIGLNFLMMTSFLAALELDWGSVLRSIFNVAKASSGGLPPLMACAGISFAAEMTLSLLLPLVVPCVPALMLAVWAAHAARAAAPSRARASWARRSCTSSSTRASRWRTCCGRRWWCR